MNPSGTPERLYGHGKLGDAAGFDKRFSTAYNKDSTTSVKPWGNGYLLVLHISLINSVGVKSER
ncbi:unnamed protein product [Clonostachys rosea f. rosea IK726]|uniref:Uncharacterized protein n=1 Tax=Clonostachys rosea f. rosea IK726 TaxID=1349383 RepID=A0ACA9UPG7_BIOOC|nr:unnamed protein product [Clonostachys rosea f. rosea IK726]